MIRFVCKNPNTGHDSAGFTLFEIVIVLLIMGLISTAVLVTLPAWISQWSIYVVRQDLLSEATAALSRMTREIRRVQDRAHVSSATPTQFVFTDTDGRTLDYNYVDNTLSRMSSDGDGQYHILAKNLTDFSFTYLGYRQNVSADVPMILDEDIDPTKVTQGEVRVGVYTNIRLVRIQMSLQRGPETVTVRTGVAPRNLQLR